MAKFSGNINLQRYFLNQFEQLEKGLNGLSKTPFHQVRRKAIQSFEQIGFPGRRTENYKYTPITRILNKDFSFEPTTTQGGQLSSEKIAALRIEGLDAYHIVLVNGEFSTSLSEINHQLNGFQITDFKGAYAAHPNLIEAHFGKYADFENDAFTALNTAFSNDGTFIKVDDNVVVEKPVVINYITDASSTKDAIQPRNLILAGKNSQVTIIENYITVGDIAGFTNAVTELVLDESAIVDYYKLELEGEKTYHVGNTQVYQVGKSTFNSTTISLEGAMIRNNLNVILDGEHCETNMYGLYLLDNDQHIDNQTEVDHKKPNSYSNELYKGIMAGNSTAIFNGKIFVRQDAQQTNAFQSNKNILLSDEASVNTKPQLEIWADDVKCSHGATIGRLDAEQLFYLRSRGIGEKEAKSLLLYAFAIDALENIKVEALKKYVGQRISRRLNTGM